MAIALPSKKIQALIIIVVGIFLAYFISLLNIGSWFRSTTASALEPIIAVSSPIQSDIDTDGDRLKDWQESLWGSDPNKKDSDGDGIEDGDEIEKGTDPIIKGPNDKLSETRGISEDTVATFGASVSSDPDNLSEAVSRDLFAKFMTLQTSGNLNDETQALLVKSVISDINPGSIPPRYTIADVAITDTNAIALRAYGNQIASVLIDLHEAALANSGNKATLAAYTDATDTLKAIKAPSTLGLAHLQILNSFNATYQMLILLSDFQNDPIKSLVAMKSIQTNTTQTGDLLASVALEFKKSDIIFDKVEAGYIWNTYQ